MKWTWWNCWSLSAWKSCIQQLLNSSLTVIVNNIFKALEPELEYNGMPTLDEFLNTSKDTTEFAGWLEVCIFFKHFQLNFNYWFLLDCLRNIIALFKHYRLWRCRSIKMLIVYNYHNFTCTNLVVFNFFKKFRQKVWWRKSWTWINTRCFYRWTRSLNQKNSPLLI